MTSDIKRIILMWPSEIEQVPLPAKTIPVITEPSTPVASAISFMRLPEVKQVTTLCRSAILALDGFPKPVQLSPSRVKVWVRAEVLNWMEARMAERNTHIAGEL